MSEGEIDSKNFLDSSKWIDASGWIPRDEKSKDKFFTENRWKEPGDYEVPMRLHTENLGISKEDVERLRTIVVVRELSGQDPEASGFKYNSEKDTFTNNEGEEVPFSDLDNLAKKLSDEYGIWYVFKPLQNNWQETVTEDIPVPSDKVH